MEVIFYYNASDARVINKALIGGESFSGVPTGEVNIMAPLIRFEDDGFLRYNYAYIPELQRYYAVESVICIRQGIWDVSFSVDVLMSFRGDILVLSAIVDKQSMVENGDEYIDDGSLVADNVMFTRLHQFEDGFNDYPEYILITAG